MRESERIVLITGATSGIGLAVAQSLAANGFFIIGVGRDAGRCERARESVFACAGQDSAAFHLCDLSSQQQIRAFAAQIAAGYGRIDVMIHAAGVARSHFMTSEDGVEMQFAVNHLAPFLLTHELMPCLKEAGCARVILVTSSWRRFARLDTGNLQMHRGYVGFVQYGRTKLCNVLFAGELNSRYAGDGLRAFAADPGLVRTDFGRKGLIGLERFACNLALRRGTDAGVPARNILFLATSEEAFRSGELCWKDCAPVRPGRNELRRGDAQRLWQASERLSMTGPWQP